MNTMKRRTLLIGLLFEATFFAQAQQTWSAPAIPGEDLNTLKATETVYFYNVEADAFVLNGMTGNTQACATRLTNNDYTITIPQQFNVYVDEGMVKAKQMDHQKAFVSCMSEAANDVLIKSGTDKNAEFAYSETTEGSRIYKLNNMAFGKDLDVSWTHGGHLTLTDGIGHTDWAFIKESNVTNGEYALYKAKKQLYSIYEALSEAGMCEAYQKALDEAFLIYSNEKATIEKVTATARELFRVVCADINKPFDASFMLDNADMNVQGNTDKWYSGSSAFSWGEFEKYHSTFTLEQENVLPMGTYDIALRSLYREDGSGTAPTLTVTTANGSVSGKTPLMGTIDYQVTNTTDNNWTKSGTVIQPNGMQSCAQALAHGDAKTWAKDAKVDANEYIKITYKVAHGDQWVNWQNFEVIYKGVSKDELLSALKTSIDKATTLYGDGSGIGAVELQDATQKATETSANAEATNFSLKSAIDELALAMKDYTYANASKNDPFDMTNLIINPSFEKQKEGWNIVDMGTQGNDVFKQKKGSLYLERWTGRGGKVGTGTALQTIEGLDLGIYQLKVGAQNIQEDAPNASQTGAYIVANNDRLNVDVTKDYTLTFTNIESAATIGFIAEAATGNWIAVDNFRLYYVGGSFEEYKKALQGYVDNANNYVNKKMHTETLNTLTAAIDAANVELQKTTTERYIKVSTPLREATEAAVVSINAFSELLKAIEKSEEWYGEGTGIGAEALLAAINTAKTVYDNGESTFEQLSEQIQLLDAADFAYALKQPTGAIPTITKTDKRYARGSVMAFGRFTYTLNGAKLREAGFCYSTKKNPTVEDSRSTRYFDNNGKIYIMENMTPSTVYYARPYVLTDGYQVAYGDELKIITLPKGGMTWSYNNGGSAEENDRINAAMEYGMYVWNMLMSTQGFHLTGNYGSGTPTADCSYGGWMRIGPNASYQRTGTIMHEAAHGVGVGTHWTWGTLLVNGTWTGPRANAVLQFWNNNTTDEMHGDGMHMWPYGINGAHEDSGTDMLYYGNALIIQAMHEDALAPTGGCFANAAYTFEQEDTVKYYIKNESSTCGLNTSFLTVENSKLKWREATSKDFATNDAFAWYITFDPKTQNYIFRNAATNEYITNSGNTLSTRTCTVPASSEKFQLLMGRRSVKVGSGTSAISVRGYWITKPDGGWAKAMNATASGSVTMAEFDLSADAATQHWIFMTEEETNQFDQVATLSVVEQLKKLIENIKTLKKTAHVEDIEGTDDAIEVALAEAEQVAEMTEPDFETVTQAVSDLRKACMDFLAGVTPASVASPFNITFLMSDPGITNGEGWTGSHDVRSSVIEYYESSFDFYQVVKGLPKGTYKLKAQAFNRPGETQSVYTAYQNGNNNSVAYLYMNNATKQVCHLAEGARRARLHSDDLAVTSPDRYVPCTIASATTYFKKGYYQNELVATFDAPSDMKIGIRQSTSASLYWTMFDNFKLYYYGSYTSDDLTGIHDVLVDNNMPLFAQPADIYSVSGALVRKAATSLEGLEKGVYIINRKKVVVK